MAVSSVNRLGFSDDCTLVCIFAEWKIVFGVFWVRIRVGVILAVQGDFLFSVDWGGGVIFFL